VICGLGEELSSATGKTRSRKTRSRKASGDYCASVAESETNSSVVSPSVKCSNTDDGETSDRLVIVVSDDTEAACVNYARPPLHPVSQGPSLEPASTRSDLLSTEETDSPEGQEFSSEDGRSAEKRRKCRHVVDCEPDAEVMSL